MRQLATLATVATHVAGCSSHAASTIEPGTRAQDTLTLALPDQVAPTNSVGSSETLTPAQPLRCDADLDQYGVAPCFNRSRSGWSARR
jgi:hypothetical protein